MHEEKPPSENEPLHGEAKAQPSIRDLPPLETGGSDARRGFDLQDHVAASFCIRMFTDTSLKEVWCENQDDVTLIWQDGAGEQVEFVQVKNNQLDALWSVAKLCERETAQPRSSDTATKTPSKKVKRIGSSMLERSLAHDRCHEPCSFRIVTSWQINKELQLLSLDAEYRATVPEALTLLVAALRQHVSDFVSPNGHDCAFWAAETTWEVVDSIQSLRSRNILAFGKYVASQGHFAAPDQMEEIYMRLVAKVADASRADWRTDRAKKRIRRDALVSWVAEAVQEAVHPGSKGGRKLRTKMKKAMLPEDSIDSAIEERARYREEMLAQRYFTSTEYRAIEGEIVSLLHSLRTQLDSGLCDDPGIRFHARCRSTLESFRESLPLDRRPHASFIYGCMYDITDRCTHRFIRATA
jgi:Cap4, dsDNA endonuclease domain